MVALGCGVQLPIPHRRTADIDSSSKEVNHLNDRPTVAIRHSLIWGLATSWFVYQHPAIDAAFLRSIAIETQTTEMDRPKRRATVW
jgi:hypothetical protein